MSNVHIDKDNNIIFPCLRHMKITVEMTEGIYEEFLQFRKDKDAYETKAAREINELRGRMTALAKAVIDSNNSKSTKARKEAKEDALELANDWFC